MLSSNLFKVLPYMLLRVTGKTYSFSLLQFGYEKKASTTDAFEIFKQIVSRYTTEGSTTYASLLYLSWAFERVD